MIPRKKNKKIGNCHQYLYFTHKRITGKLTEILQKRDFFTWSIQNFMRNIKKVKQFVRKYIT